MTFPKGRNCLLIKKLRAHYHSYSCPILDVMLKTVIFITIFQWVYVTVFVYWCLVFQKLPFRFLNQSITEISSCFPSCYMSHQSHPPLLNHPSNIKWLTFLSFSICNFFHTNIILFFSQILFSVFVLNDISHYSGYQFHTHARQWVKLLHILNL